MALKQDLERVLSLVDGDTSEPPSALPCSAHKSHAPEPSYTEQHHVIPQAFQHFWHPDGATPDGKLFDARTVPLCRTGHGNTHFILVRLTRYFSEQQMTDPAQGDAETFVAALAKKALKGVKHEKAAAEIAQLGLVRWIAAGGSVQSLCEHGLWGSI